MNETGSMLFLYTETPLHAGSGIALGAVDLPIQRERMTNLPMVQGSGIKGSLRQMFRERYPNDEENRVLQLFGPEPKEREQASGEEEEFAGALSVQDARLLLMPVRTVWGGFAWVTSPLILERLARDLAVVKGAPLPLSEQAWKELQAVGEDAALVSTKSTVVGAQRLILEDLDYAARSSEAVDKLADWLRGSALPAGEEYGPFRDRLAQQLVILSDTEVKHWAEHGTEVVARIRIDPATGSVKDGALWSEESLPAETLLWSPAFFTRGRRPSKDGSTNEEAQALKEWFSEGLSGASLRLGGDRTVGRGLVRMHLLDGAKKEKA